MHKHYHVQITTRALQERFSTRALQAILQANTCQDNLSGQLWHPEYHFDACQFKQGNIYLAKQRSLVQEALTHGDRITAWQAFGRLTHAVQDFYAHSSYIRLWVAQHDHEKPVPMAEQIDPLDLQLLTSPELISGRVYYPWELLSFIPGLAPIMRRILPKDSHTNLNLDGPERGPLFDYALVAARKRTVQEFEQICLRLSQDALRDFSDLPMTASG